MAQVNVTQVVVEVMQPFVDSSVSTTAETMRFDAGLGSAWWLVAQITDGGDELRAKNVKALRVTGRLTNAAAMGFAYDVGQPIDIPDLEDGMRSSTRTTTRPQSLPDTTGVTQSARKPINITGVLHTVRVEGDDTGQVERDRIDEIVMEQAVQGVRR